MLREADKNVFLQDLRLEIEKGWDGESSSRTIGNIIQDKQLSSWCLGDLVVKNINNTHT